MNETQQQQALQEIHFLLMIFIMSTLQKSTAKKQ